MRPAFFLLIPILTATIIAVAMYSISARSNAKGVGPFFLVSFFLYCSYIVANVFAGADTLKISNNFGVNGLVERVLFGTLIYAAIIFALSKTLKFKSRKQMLLFITISSGLFGIFFDVFLTAF